MTFRDRFAESRSAQGNNGDSRAVLIFIFWPIVLIAVGTGAFIVSAMFTTNIGEGTLLPVFIVLGIGLAGLLALPFLIRSTYRAFKGRGFSGFWRGARSSTWGDGGIGETGGP